MTPLFFPFGSSSSTPTQKPGAKSVSPRNLTKPILVWEIWTLGEKHSKFGNFTKQNGSTTSEQIGGIFWIFHDFPMRYLSPKDNPNRSFPILFALTFFPGSVSASFSFCTDLVKISEVFSKLSFSVAATFSEVKPNSS